MSMSRNELKDFILSFYKAWKEQDEEKVESFYAPGVVAYVDYKPVSLNDMLERLRFSKRIFTTAEYNIKDLFFDVEAGKISVRMDQYYVTTEGERITCQSMTSYRISDFKIQEIWMSFYPNVNYQNNEEVEFVS